jgi:hypothetical protein
MRCQACGWNVPYVIRAANCPACGVAGQLEFYTPVDNYSRNPTSNLK